MITARFWVWVNSGWVRLALRDGESVCHVEVVPDWDGYKSKAQEWTREGDSVGYYRRIDSRDCDGFFRTECELACDVSDLEALSGIDDGPRVPDWKEWSSTSKDSHAERTTSWRAQLRRRASPARPRRQVRR
jgi:hypothetical protein